jgi:hypothetical protein
MHSLAILQTDLLCMLEFRTERAEREEIKQTFRLDFHQLCTHCQSVAESRPSREIAGVRSFMRIEGIERFQSILNEFDPLWTTAGEVWERQACDEVSERS